MSARRPNILWIVTTQWRARSCGYAGDPDARTPHLDALAARALNFRQAVTPHPFGPFARAALLTGVPSPENGVRDYFDPLPAGARTVAHTLRERGYGTAFFGKWHLARRARDVPLVGEAHARTIVPAAERGGFEVWDGFEGGFLLNDPWLHGFRSAEPEQVRGYQSDVVCGRAAEFLAGETKAERPWFAMVSLEPPHPPYAAPAGEAVPRDPAQVTLRGNVPRGGEVEARARRELAGYLAHIEATDRAIGRHLLPVAERAPTFVVFTSVHGDMHGAHGLFRKGWPHEESVRVPMLVAPPAPVAAADQAWAAGALVSLLDLPRWTQSWVEAPAAMWRRPATAGVQRISMPSVVALPDQCDRQWHGVRTASRKAVWNAEGTPWLLFDLERDPEETTNLVGAPGAAEELVRLTRAMASDSR